MQHRNAGSKNPYADARDAAAHDKLSNYPTTGGVCPANRGSEALLRRLGGPQTAGLFEVDGEADSFANLTVQARWQEWRSELLTGIEMSVVVSG